MEARELPQPQPQAFELVLRIRHPSMDPEDISAELEISAEHCFKCGDPRKPQGGAGSIPVSPTTTTSVHNETFWLATLNPGGWGARAPAYGYLPGRLGSARASDTPNEMTRTVLSLALTVCIARFLQPHTDFFRRIHAEGGQVRLLVEVNTTVVDNFTLTPELGRAIDALGITIDFEFSAS